MSQHEFLCDHDYIRGSNHTELIILGVRAEWLFWDTGHAHINHPSKPGKNKGKNNQKNILFALLSELKIYCIYQ